MEARRNLILVGLTDDGTRLVLVDESGDEFTLAADTVLRAALRGEHARLGQLEIQMDSALRPRDIQARIRTGESPEMVAAAAQTTVDRIMVFASPVLAERAHVADRAQRSSVRRVAGDGPARLLGDAVAERLTSRNVDPRTVEWDAWRRQDGRWTLVADYLSGESTRHAEFVYDALGRFVVAEDDEARWLVGEQSTRKGPQPRVGGAPRRLTAVSTEDELPLGADTIDMISGDAGPDVSAGGGLDSDPDPDARADESPDETADESTVDLTEAAAAVSTGSPEHPSASPDEPRSEASSESPSESSGEPSSEPFDEPPSKSSGDPLGEAADVEHGDEAVGEGEEELAGETVGGEPPPRPARKSRGRASVPSWDEIMFGGGRSE